MRHVQVGADIVQDSHRLKALTLIIRHHHEWFDGSGYPDGLIGSEIPLEARILAVADAFAAMISDRPYRKAKPFFEIIEEFRQNSGSQFDPDVVEALFEILDREGIESLFALIPRDTVANPTTTPALTSRPDLSTK
jgi:HD-GYP domain-containing protein (c-di-GMP phosphodiesterase class II)